ncbi:hypothetical protein K431DRAFT_320241 [Polychaeton citri CBS 116435]|uniref:SAC domain-containing protein n=1 Tax=Polychaeton citri CBS 116435 TaxID=1314669 RepID=A0A9P4UMR9_9PEZI|nr:hypothetical protein K431DRAFT_320241 [Polychaeton citri CBS 116435]
MDHGPVDAGPQNDRGYEEATTGPYSPESTKVKPVERHLHHDNELVGDAMHNESQQRDIVEDNEPQLDQRTASVTSNGSLKDPPLYPRVGATLEEVSGDICVDNMQNQRDTSQPASPKAHSENGNVSNEASSFRIFRFVLYETSARYWITGSDSAERRFKLLRIDRTCPPGRIALIEDDVVYDRQQVNEILTTIDDGNKATGGLKLKCKFWGLLGFIRFTEAYYMLIVTKGSRVAIVGGHYIYQIDATELVPLTTGPSSRFLQNRNPEEARFVNVLHNLDLGKHFYFSYSYDITHSLQHNIIRQREALANDKTSARNDDFNSMFVWNHHLLKPGLSALRKPFDWCLPIIHGFIDQSSLDVFGRSVYITIIGRRSRFFAGARFLKRGVNDQGFVANDVETEQIVSEMLTTSFHAPGPKLFTNPTWTSYVHHRGSIPLYWTQDNSGVSPRPDIDLNLHDPFYQPAALHFDNLFERYGCPVYVLNLIKARERTPRESKLLVEFQNVIEYLNQSLPSDKKIQYKAFDMSRASKTRGGDVIGSLEVIAAEIVRKTGFFHNGEVGESQTQVQNGVARTNCIDCLDRTNAAQFVIGKHAFGQQLKALGVIDCDDVDYDTDATNMFTHMFHDHGDTIAVQYGGSHLVNTMATYRKLNHWQSSSRDMVESFKRYYHNSFLDNQRQEAYNLFLGNYIWAQGQPMLWDLPTDYYLHHSNPRAWLERKRRNYIDWYTPEFLEERRLPGAPYAEEVALHHRHQHENVSLHDDYWTEYYRPLALSSLEKVHAYHMTSTNQYLPDRPPRDGPFDFSPFKTRLNPNRHAVDSPDKKRKGVKILDPQDDVPVSLLPSSNAADGETKPSGILREPTDGRVGVRALQQFGPDASMPDGRHASKLSNTMSNTSRNGSRNASINSINTAKNADKDQMHLWTLNQFHYQSLHPTVSDREQIEYTKYMSHPLNLPLVVSSEVPSDANIDYIEYVQKSRGSGFEDVDELDFDEDALGGGGISEQDLRDFDDFVTVREDPLTITEEDGEKKRYKAYRQWLRGKSLFKQSKVDPEFVG